MLCGHRLHWNAVAEVLQPLSCWWYGTYARSSIVIVLVLEGDAVEFEYDYEHRSAEHEPEWFSSAFGGRCCHQPCCHATHGEIVTHLAVCRVAARLALSSHEINDLEAAKPPRRGEPLQLGSHRSPPIGLTWLAPRNEAAVFSVGGQPAPVAAK